MAIPFKKTTLSLLLFSHYAVFAGTMGPVEPRYDGLYLGADVGVADLVDKQTTSGPTTLHHFSNTGIVGGGLVGYDYSINERFKLGLEGFINANELNLATRVLTPPTSSYTANSRYNGGVRLLPGYQFQPGFVGHVLLGYSNARFHIQDSGDYGLINQSFNQGGFQCGLGMKTQLSQHLSLRGDALYTTYSNTTHVGIGDTVGFPSTQTYGNQFSTIEGDLTLIYKFTSL